MFDTWHVKIECCSVYVCEVQQGLLSQGLGRTRPVNSDGRVKYKLGVFRVRVEYGSGVFRFYGFRINPTGLERLFLGYFIFCQNQKLVIFIT